MLTVKKKYLGKGSLVTVFKGDNSFNILLDNPLPGQLELLPKEYVEEQKKEK
jgi:hypothetical protein